MTRYLYTGREYDNDTDAYYYRARWYDPRTGRFISKDPIGFAAGDANLYRYVGNGPTNARDPSGLTDELDAAKERLQEIQDVQSQTHADWARVAAATRKIKDIRHRAYVAYKLLDELQSQLDLLAFDSEWVACEEKAAARYAGGNPVLRQKAARVLELYAEYLEAFGQFEIAIQNLRSAASGLERPPADYDGPSFFSRAIENVDDIAIGFIPVVGEMSDVLVIIDDEASGPDRALSCGSLLLSIVTVGGSPNAGRAADSIRSIDDVAGEVQELIAAAQNSEWVRPKGWRLPKNGTWEGTPGHSSFKPSNPAELELKPGEVIPFREGRPDFSQWSKGNFTSKQALTGTHALDEPKMIEALAEAKGWTPSATRDWLRNNQCVLHHAGGDSFQLVDGRLHGATAWGYNGVRHMRGAFDLRNQ